jgi:hypothetical protein
LLYIPPLWILVFGILVILLALALISIRISGLLDSAESAREDISECAKQGTRLNKRLIQMEGEFKRQVKQIDERLVNIERDIKVNSSSLKDLESIISDAKGELLEKITGLNESAEDTISRIGDILKDDPYKDVYQQDKAQNEEDL